MANMVSKHTQGQANKQTVNNTTTTQREAGATHHSDEDEDSPSSGGAGNGSEILGGVRAGGQKQITNEAFQNKKFKKYFY